MDRISFLPDYLLHHIFSSLNSKILVQCSLLSKRWRYLWTSMPFLNFTYSTPFNRKNIFGENSYFNRFVLRVLLHRSALCEIKKLTFIISMIHQSFGNLLFYFAAFHRVQQLSFSMVLPRKTGLQHDTVIKAKAVPVKLKTFIEMTMDIASASPRHYFFEGPLVVHHLSVAILQHGKREQDNFIIDPSREAVQVYLHNRMTDALNEFRGKLHRHYKNIRDKDGIQVARASNHAQVEDMNDWVFLCDMWETPKFKAIAEVNVENRGKMKYNHNTGSRSHARVMIDHQAVDEDHEVAFNEIDLFRVTHTNDQGVWVNDAAKEDYNLMCDMLVAPDVEVDGVVQPRLTEVHIIEKVRGYRSGYIKGLGAGPAHNRKSIHVPTRSRASQDQIVTQLLEENKELKEKFTQLYSEVANMKTMFMSFTQTPPTQ